ncbi:MULTISPECIES: hypothetical protein [Francisella]|uniref:hypothetical protein n=1 Tax=Francisella TaxID=262 RepID=UPI0011B5976A|nr:MULTISPECIES: hypothetical protein [Francisella]
MSIQRHLTLSIDDQKLELEVASFEYLGKINNGYDVEFIAYTDENIQSFIGCRFDFSYSGVAITGGSIRGYVKEAILGYDSKQARQMYRIICRSVVGFLKDYYLKKMFSDSSNQAIITNMLETLCSTQADFIGLFDSLEIQQNSSQLLNGNAFEFFNYQFNNYGFYIANDKFLDRDVVDIYSQPNDLIGMSGSYNVTKSANQTAINQVKSFKKHTYKHLPDLDILGYDIDLGQDATIADSPFAITEENAARIFYDNNFKQNDAKELTKRINLSINSLNGLSQLTLENIVHREGDIIELTSGVETKKYWVYSSHIRANVEETKHWAIETHLNILELTDNPWYPPLAAKPLTKVVEGFKYNSQQGLGKYNKLPIKSDIPFNQDKDLSYTRNVSLSSSKTGGVYSSPQSDSRLVLATSDNNREYVSLGFSSDATADEHVSSKNIQDSGIYSAGNVGLGFTRTRAGQDYSKVSLYGQSSEGKVSELGLGGENTTSHNDDFTRNTFSNDYPNLEGIIKRSINSAIDIAAGDIALNYGDIENITVDKRTTSDKATDHYRHTINSDNYLHRYFIKNFSENKSATNAVDTNFITDFKLNTAKINDNYQTTVIWATERPTANKIELDGQQEKLTKQYYSFEKKQNNYNFKITLDNQTQLIAQGTNLDENIKSISIQAEPLSKTKTYGLVVGWSIFGKGSLEISGNSVEISKQRVFVELKDAEPLVFKFDINGNTSTLTVQLCQLKAIKSDLAPLPDADEIITADDSGINYQSNLEQHIVYTDKLVASDDNPETDILTWHDNYTSQNYNNTNSSKLVGQYQANKLAQAKSYHTDSLAKAEDISTDAIYKRDHQGNLSVIHNAKFEETKKLSDRYETKNIAENEIKKHTETVQLEDYTKKAETNIKGDITMQSNKATRGYAEYSLTGLQGMNWEIEKLELNAKESKIIAKEYNIGEQDDGQ